MAYPNILTSTLALVWLISIALAGKVTDPSKVPAKAVLLSDVASLTLRSGKQTTSRRVDSVPQLQCTGPSRICSLYEVDVMRCANEGADYDVGNIQWSCKATLPEDFKLGSTDVICEGYESADDPYVLKGSCGVEYRLLLTEKGEEKYGKTQPDYEMSGSGAAAVLFFVVFAAVLFFILRGLWRSWNGRLPRPHWTRWNGGSGGGGGGGGGGDNNDPPPPYDGHMPYSDQPRKPTTRTTTPRTNTRSLGGSSRSAPQGQQSGGPGFWTGAGVGAGAGAAAGYLAGRRPEARNETRQPEYGQAPPQQQQSPALQSPSTPSYGSFPTPSRARYESTGFGETRRR